jgi:hypothetical protein
VQYLYPETILHPKYLAQFSTVWLHIIIHFLYGLQDLIPVVTRQRKELENIQHIQDEFKKWGNDIPIEQLTRKIHHTEL